MMRPGSHVSAGAPVAGSNQGGELGDVLVLGMGKTGQDVARYLAGLAREDPPRVRSVTLYGGAGSAEGPLADDLRAAGIEVRLGTEEVGGAFDLAIASPGIPEGSAFARSARARSAELVGEPEFAWRESPERWVAITGTNGKTTTTALTAALLSAGGLKAEAVGNIGRLITGELARRPADGWFVAELSSFQLATTRWLHPRLACLLNITPDHLAWHGSMEAYAAAKERAFAHLGEGCAQDLAVVSVDDPWSAAIARRVAAAGVRTCELSVEGEPAGPSAAYLRGGRLVVRIDGRETDVCALSDLVLRGRHNAQNALAASAMALELGVGRAVVAATLATFAPLEHRIEPCGTIGGVSYVNDSKATNVDSTIQALGSFPAGRVVCLLGGHDKGTDLGALAEVAARSCRAVVCYGEAGRRIGAALGASCEVAYAAHLADALEAASAIARPGDTVLLSPACSSFDEFGNFEERGRAFKRLVAQMSARGDGPQATGGPAPDTDGSAVVSKEDR